MKAAVLHEYGQSPKFEDFKEPLSQNQNQILIAVKASAIKQLDKAKASGKHYTSHGQLPAVVGTDGAGTLQDGTRVYANGIAGMMSEKALIPANGWVKIPDEVSFEIAAALPNALLGTDAALLCRAHIQRGSTVLINGATGVTGQMAIQVAKHRGAARVIATGRDEQTFDKLKSLGADEIVSLKQADEQIINRLREIQAATPIDIVMDYLYGHPIELILAAFKDSAPRRVKIVAIGAVAGEVIPFSSQILRGTKIEFIGSGIGSISTGEWNTYLKDHLSEMLLSAANGKLKMDIVTYPLMDVEYAWKKNEGAKRAVIVI